MTMIDKISKLGNGPKYLSTLMRIYANVMLPQYIYGKLMIVKLTDPYKTKLYIFLLFCTVLGTTYGAAAGRTKTEIIYLTSIRSCISLYRHK